MATEEMLIRTGVQTMNKPFHKIILYLLAYLLTSLASLSAQTESLLIGPGDMVHLQIFEVPDLDQHVRVMDNGKVHLLLIGDVPIAGLTPAAAAGAIESFLIRQNLVRRPQALVTVEEYATQKTSIVGEVKAPGSYFIQTDRSILEILSIAGGLTELADRKIKIQRHHSQEVISFFYSNDATDAIASSLMISPGDTVIVPKAGIAYVLGDVRQPGGYTMTNNDSQLSVLQLVARAGGTNNTAIPARARLIRKKPEGYSETPLDISKMQRGIESDITLSTGDVIYIPFSYSKNFFVQGSGIAATVGSAAIYRF